jgi:hypothetical protein
MKLRISAVVAALSLLFSAGIASANGEDDKREGDTLFNFGYDAQERLFLFNTQATDASPFDCTLENGTLTAKYGKQDTDGEIPVEELVGNGPVSFGATGFELAEGPQEDTQDSIDYPGPENECRISAYAFGDQGHINHGQFMKLFNSLIDMRGGGCLNRWLAQSGLGKGDQQVKTQDFEDPEDVKVGIDFETVIATCDHGKKVKDENHIGNGRGNRDKDEDHPGQGQGNGHQDEPDEADEADEGKGAGHGRPGSPGKSNDAHGRPDK